MAGLERETEVRDALLRGRRRPPAGWVVAPDDDAAVLPLSAWAGGPLVLTCDGVEEDVHFRMGWQEPSDLGWKVVAVALSDLAAKAAIPVAYHLSVSWPERLDASVAAEVAKGLRQAESAFGVGLVGGDTDVTKGPLRLTATALGRCEPPAPVLRNGARQGDSLFVTGPLGAAAAVVKRLLEGEPMGQEPAWVDAVQRFRRPIPRLAEAKALAAHATAMMDLSDGLLPDLARLLTESGLAARIDRSRVPVHAAAAACDDEWTLATAGGEDYELLLAGPRELGRSFPGLVEIGCTEAGVPGKIRVDGAGRRDRRSP